MNDSAPSFPEFPEDLNDSEIIRCTQAVEEQFQEQKEGGSDCFRIMDLVDPLSKEFEKKHQTIPRALFTANNIINNEPRQQFKVGDFDSDDDDDIFSQIEFPPYVVDVGKSDNGAIAKEKEWKRM